MKIPLASVVHCPTSPKGLSPVFGKLALGQEFRDQHAPTEFRRRQRAPILAAGFLDMAGPAKRLQAIDIERVLARLALQRRDVVALQAPGPTALDAPEVVALEDGAADGLPAFAVQGNVVMA